jgi:hypothetical protein
MITHWGVQWYSKDRIDGESRYFLWDDGRPALFRTRQLARDWIRERYGDIATRRDLRVEPFGWRVPKALRVEVAITEVTP